jgi:hypothetical protein
MRRGEGISIWFFTGISLPLNGLLIFGSGIHEVVHPPEVPVVLFKPHASICATHSDWSALLH